VERASKSTDKRELGSRAEFGSSQKAPEGVSRNLGAYNNAAHKFVVKFGIYVSGHI
jgi:hypothetical protein